MSSPRALARIVLIGSAFSFAATADTTTPPTPLIDAPAQALAREISSGAHSGVLGFALSVDGRSVASSAEPGTERRADIRSATKSITALLVGIALERKELPGLDAKIADLLPRHQKELAADPRKAAMTLADLLTMRSGLDCDDWDAKSPGHEDKMYETRDWVAFWASRPMRDRPGERFSYCTGNVIAIGQILAQATGQGVDVYAQKNLFDPLGLPKVEWQRWDRGREVDSGGHVRLTAEALLRVGEMVLAQGRVGERQVVPASWIEAMTTPRTAIPGRKQTYGYLWWLDETSSPGLPKTRLWFAQGNGGNFLIVLPEVRAVVAFTGTRFNRPEAMEPMFWLRDRLMPGLGTAAQPSSP
jgi:CubicO group peptidase (beta-lactamase class C family)